MVDEKKEEQTSERKAMDQKILINRKNHAEKMLDFVKRDLELKEKITEYELNNCEIINDKLKFMIDPEYVEIVNEIKKLNLEINSMKLKDQISQFEHEVDALNKEINKMAQDIVESDKKDEKDGDKDD